MKRAGHLRRFAWRLAAVAGVSLGLLGAAPSTASADVSPILECVFHDTHTGQYNSLWGYNNDDDPTTIRVGWGNQFSPSPQGRGQPTTFASGRHDNVFTVTWDGSTNLKWSVDNSATAKTSSPACSSNPVPLVPGTGSVVLALPFVFLAGGIAALAWYAHRRGLTVWRRQPGP